MQFRFILIFMVAIVLVGCSKPKNQYQGYVEGENIYLASPFSGALVKLYVERGQKVKKGQLLFSLDPKPQTFSQVDSNALLDQGQKVLLDLQKAKRPPEIEAIEAQIAQTQAQIALAALRVRRNKTLFEKHAMDKDTLDAAVEHYNEVMEIKAQYEANLAFAKLGARSDQIDAQKAQIKALLSRVYTSKWNLAQKTLRAPADGFIFDTYYRKAEFVAAERPVLSLLTPENTRIEFFVPLKALNSLQVGKNITFTYQDAKQAEKAVISYISPEAEYMPPLVYSRENSDNIVFRVKAQVKNSKQIFPGEPVVVTIESQDA